MKSCQVIAVFVGGLLLGISPAQADILEIKGKGFVNGEILSEDTKELKFKDADGNALTFQKSDILFIEKEDNSKKHAAPPKPDAKKSDPKKKEPAKTPAATKKPKAAANKVARREPAEPRKPRESPARNAVRRAKDAVKANDNRLSDDDFSSSGDGFKSL